MSSVTTTITSPQRHQPHQQQQHQQQQQQQKKACEINLTDDPDKLLNEWLGELENLIGVSLFTAFCFIFHTKKTLVVLELFQSLSLK